MTAAHTKARAVTLRPLAGLPDDSAVVVQQILHPRDVARQLAHLGILPGAELVVRRSASFGGPLFVEIRGAAVLLARKLARGILVSVPA